MPDTGEGVLDSTASETQDRDFLNEEDPNLSGDEKLAPGESGDRTKLEEPPVESKESEESEEAKEEEKPKEEKPFPYDRPTMQQLREEFPDLFKKFPSMRDIYYREQEFS